MKRGGILAFIIYLLLGLGSIVTLLIFDINPPAFNTLGAALATITLLIYCAIFFTPLLVVKALHMLTGWKLFSIICVIGNIAIIGLFVFIMILNMTADFKFDDISATLIITAPSAIALVSEIVGLKRS